MTELTLPDSPRKPACFWTLLVAQFYILCSFVVSHPLYFCYIVFFSPYLFRLLSFLSPLFVTTSLLLTFSPAFFHGSSATPLLPESAGTGTFLHAAVRSLLDLLRFISDDELEDFHGSPRFLQDLEEFMEAFEAIPEVGRSEINSSYAETASFCSYDDCAETASLCSSSCAETAPASGSDEDQIVSLQPAVNQEAAGELQCKYGCWVEDGEANVEAKRTGSETAGVRHGNDEVVWRAVVDEGKNSEGKRICAGEMSPNLGRSMGSMRQEKEWKRTLACKLFEERHSGGGSGAEGGEDMDSLWETYEAESTTKACQVKKKTKKKKNRETGAGKKKVIKKVDLHIGGDEKDEEEGEEDDEGVGQLCCLQALNFSAGKMNLGMGRPGLAKISKTFKGFGWLHHLGHHARRK